MDQTTSPKIAIIQFPGTNCERETAMAVQRAGMHPVDFLWNQNSQELLTYDGFIIAGGFSYEDRCRSGVIAALDPLLELLCIADSQGKPILGICNGAQILVESMLTPNVGENIKAVALADNLQVSAGKILAAGFYNNWINVTANNVSNNNIFLKYFTNNVITIPTAHAQGRFLLAPDLYQLLLKKKVGFLYYCTVDGQLHCDFPTNPNGSMHNIAAMGNLAGNILAIMPHPERTVNGDLIFQAMADYIRSKNYVAPIKCPFFMQPPAVENFVIDNSSLNFVVKLLITDNEALSVNNALRALKFNVTLQKYIFWQINYCDVDSQQLREALINSWELFNPNKEEIISLASAKNSSLVFCQQQDNLAAEEKKQVLKDHYGLSGISGVKKFVLWRITAHEGNVYDITNDILQRNILTHPLIHNTYIATHFAN